MKAKKGISLIVLVITIIVIIILAGAVILNLTQNNPINSAKVARLVQEKESLESAISLYLSQQIAKTSGDYTVEQILTAKTSSGAISGMTALVGTNALTSNTKAQQMNAALSKTLLGITPSSSAAWYVDVTSGKCYYKAASVEEWMKNETADTTITNPTLAGFVVTE